MTARTNGPMDDEPDIVAFCCHYCAFTAADLKRPGYVLVAAGIFWKGFLKGGSQAGVWIIDRLRHSPSSLLSLPEVFRRTEGRSGTFE